MNRREVKNALSEDLTRTLRTGKSLRWVADQLGHADPVFTQRVYGHAMRDEESDLSFAALGGSKRLYPAPAMTPD